MVLDSLQLATRDEMTTMLRFTCENTSIRVQHLGTAPLSLFSPCRHANLDVKQVEFTTPPYPSSVTSADVLFRGTHPITLLLEDGNLLLHVAQPHYKFPDVSTRHKFQELVRARKLITEMTAIEVFPLFSRDDGTGGLDRCSTNGTASTSSMATTTTSSSGRSSTNTFWRKSITGKKTDRHQKKKQEMQCLAWSEPLQLWQQLGGGAQAETMTFVANGEQLVRTGGISDKWRLLEWHAKDLDVRGAPRVVVGGRSSAPWAVEMWWDIRPTGAAPGVRITFGKKSGKFQCLVCYFSVSFFGGRRGEGNDEVLT